MKKEEIKTLIKKVSTQKNFGGKMFYDNFEKYLKFRHNRQLRLRRNEPECSAG